MRSRLSSLRLVILAVSVALAAACSSSPNEAPAAIDDVGHDEDDHGAAGDLADAGPEDDSDASVIEAPPHDDAGAPHHDAGPATCALVTPPHGPQLRYGLHPLASDGLRSLGVNANGISQTIGNAAASAGTHAQDGTFMGLAYSAATDIRIAGRTEAQIAVLLDQLASVGFAAWYRKPGFDGWPSYDAVHIHAVYVGAPMKLILRNQVRDWMAGKNGLASHAPYKFHAWSKCQRDPLWARFVAHNPAVN